MHVKFNLVHHNNDQLGKAWENHFGDEKNVNIISGDICNIQCDAIISPANSFGFMDGGLDYALSEYFGWDLEKQVQKFINSRPLKELLVGEALIVPTGHESVPWLIVAPTMRVPMRLRQSVNAYLAMKAILSTVITHAKKKNIKEVAIPGLGSGVGRLPVEVAALQMWEAWREIVLGEVDYPDRFGTAQRRHINLNPEEINVWDP